MVVIPLPRRPSARNVQDVMSFVRVSCRQLAIDENKIIDLAHAIAEPLTSQYVAPPGPGERAHIPQTLRDEYVLGYVMGYVVAACGEVGYAAQSRELLLCWLLVAHQMFDLSLNAATALLERCDGELQSTAHGESFGKGVVEGGIDRVSALRGVPTRKLRAHLQGR